MVTGWSLHTEDHSVLALHNDPDEYQRRLVLAKVALHEVFQNQVAPKIGSDETVLDIGSATGEVAKIMRQIGHRGPIIANDISASNLRWTMERGLYSGYILGPADDVCQTMLQEKDYVDWAILISVTYYFSPDRLGKLLTTLGHLCRKGIVVTYDGVPQSMTETWSEAIGQQVLVYDHRSELTNWAPSVLWSNDTVWSGIGWSGSESGIEVPCDFVLIHKQ